MTERERTIKGLECCIKADDIDCPKGCPFYKECFTVNGSSPFFPALRAALKLLKELPDIVRCGECKHYKDGFCYNPSAYDDEITCGNTSPDWYCADGKRR